MPGVSCQEKPLSLLSQVFNTNVLPRHALAADVFIAERL
jgi:hypothetical protein